MFSQTLRAIGDYSTFTDLFRSMDMETKFNSLLCRDFTSDLGKRNNLALPKLFFAGICFIYVVNLRFIPISKQKAGKYLLF